MAKDNVLIVVAGPSGVGKGTVCSKVFKHMQDIEFSVSATTRQARKGEKEGVNYFFVSREKFDEMAANDEFLEYADVFGNRYGTPRKYVEEKLNSKRDVLLEIDIQGAMMVMERCPEALFIFILPPSFDELKKRLVKRGSESEEQLAMRLSKAKEEMSYAPKFDYIVVNDDLDSAAIEVISIIVAEKCSVKRNTHFIDGLIKS
ncbi:MAG: guanylate kinase [Clostridia bacterium]|nr:guanylate kinase [Clostridia bacterium]